MRIFDAVNHGWLPTAYWTPTPQVLQDLLDELLRDELPPDLKLPDRGQWVEAADQWRNLDNPWISPDRFLTILESWMLDKVRQDRALNNPETRRAARLWCTFAPPRPWQGVAFRDLDHRWYPLDRDGQRPLTVDDAVALVQAIEDRRGVAYALPFPVVNPGKCTSFLIECWVSRLEFQPEDDPSPCARVVVAPWSEFLVQGSNIDNLDRALSACRGADGKPLLEPDTRFLLEFGKLAGAAQPDSVLVDGDSLDLAILMAAWAALRQPALLPVVATGLIDPSTGNIGRVDSILEKWESVVAYATNRELVFFIGPRGTREEVRNPDGHKRVRTEEVETPDDLLKLIGERLSDGCEGYRRLLDERGAIVEVSDDGEVSAGQLDTFDAGDVKSLNAFAATALRAQQLKVKGRLPVEALPFGNDPRRAAQHVARAVLASEGDQEGKVIPLLFPLHVEDDARPKGRGRGASDEDLVWHLRQGVRDAQVAPHVPQADATEAADLIKEVAIRNLLVDFHHRLLLIIYDQRSGELKYGDHDKQRIKGILARLRQRVPKAQAVLIASDWHHLLWLADVGVASKPELSQLSSHPFPA
jgi:hypothetical protein